MSGRTKRQDEQARRSEPTDSPWVRAMRGPWTVVCVVTAVLVGPAAATASALERANAAPPPHAPPRESAKSVAC